ncbi:hypothetical protein PVAP13_9KG309914 [Panicum virgatum]|uniref:Uncharacterized protein n=1 Tax=Panicum virgatum TaxID=38727 RepID=A0A8T0NUU9_PANVG|nr:hypothetical protein PVAP13_9KG309914 [Panicum virgatum]
MTSCTCPVRTWAGVPHTNPDRYAFVSSSRSGTVMQERTVRPRRERSDTTTFSEPTQIYHSLTHPPHPLIRSAIASRSARHGGTRSRRSRRRRRRADAPGRVDEPVRDQGARRAQPQGPRLPLPRGRPHHQERAPPRLQPRAREGPGAPPQRQARLRVPPHPGVPRRGVPGPRPAPPPRRRPLRPRRCSILGLLRRRQAVQHVDTRLHRPDEGGVGDMSKSSSSQYDLKAQEDIDSREIRVTNGPMR